MSAAFDKVWLVLKQGLSPLQEDIQGANWMREQMAGFGRQPESPDPENQPPQERVESHQPPQMEDQGHRWVETAPCPTCGGTGKISNNHPNHRPEGRYSNYIDKRRIV